MARYGLVIDLDYCIGCYNCQIACKDEHVGNEFALVAKSQPTFDHFWVGIEEVERNYSDSRIEVTYIPTLSQSKNLLDVAKDGEVYERPDGIVIIDPEKAAGKKELLDACPSGRVYWNEEANVAQKCTFCAHLLDSGWTEPRCVQSCPTSCMIFGDRDDPNSEISKALANGTAQPYNPNETDPSVHYIGLPSPVVSGTVILGDCDECADGAVVTLLDKGGAIANQSTDCFGDFLFKDLDVGKYKVKVEKDGYESNIAEIEVECDVTQLGDIILH